MFDPFLPPELQQPRYKGPSLLFQKLKRKRVDRALLRRLRPKQPRTEELRYLNKLDHFWDLWRSGVAAELDIRLDSLFSERSDAAFLEATFNQLLQNAGLGKFLTDLGSDLSDRAEKYMRNIARIPTTVPGKEQLIEEFRRQNISLIKNVGTEQVARITEVLRAASAEGLRAESFTKEVMHALDIGEGRAQRIARDQVLKFNSQVTMQAAKEAGAEEYTWSTSNDERVREDHAVLDGHIFRYDDPPVTDTRTGATNNPGEDYECRCAAIPHFALFEGNSVE